MAKRVIAKEAHAQFDFRCDPSKKGVVLIVRPKGRYAGPPLEKNGPLQIATEGARVRIDESELKNNTTMSVLETEAAGVKRAEERQKLLDKVPTKSAILRMVEAGMLTFAKRDSDEPVEVKSVKE